MQFGETIIVSKTPWKYPEIDFDNVFPLTLSFPDQEVFLY